MIPHSFLINRPSSSQAVNLKHIMREVYYVELLASPHSYVVFMLRSKTWAPRYVIYTAESSFFNKGLTMYIFLTEWETKYSQPENKKHNLNLSSQGQTIFPRVLICFNHDNHLRNHPLSSTSSYAPCKCAASHVVDAPRLTYVSFEFHDFNLILFIFFCVEND